MATRVLGVVGFVGAAAWLALNTVLSPEWGPPGSGNYLGYETINRLWGPCFAAMLAGYVGFFARRPLPGRLGRGARWFVFGGLTAMIFGNVAEFWFFTDLAHGEWNARSLAWMLVLVGMLSLLIGLALAAWAGARERVWPPWVSAAFALALPVTLALVFTGSAYMFIVLPLVSGLAGALAVRRAAARPTARPAPPVRSPATGRQS
ncbi:MAG: hypothetical protein IT317_19485 [Anaerolineales bacterium]|nr:hypothetical protein [Anaerolineales bacterium]